MQVSLTPERALKLKNACENLLATASPCIRDVAQVLGLMTSSFPGVMYGPLHHKFLEMDKTQALKMNKGNFNKNMSLSPEATADLKWWISALDTTYNLINHGELCCYDNRCLSDWMGLLYGNSNCWRKLDSRRNPT